MANGAPLTQCSTGNCPFMSVRLTIQGLSPSIVASDLIQVTVTPTMLNHLAQEIADAQRLLTMSSV